MNPLHAIPMSNAALPGTPSFDATMQAVAGNKIIRRNGRDDETVDFLGLEGRARQCVFCSRDRQVAGCLVRRGDVPPLHSGAGGDPLIGGVEDLLEIRVRQDLGRRVVPGRQRCVRPTLNRAVPAALSLGLTTSRLLYVPQFSQTKCGRLG